MAKEVQGTGWAFPPSFLAEGKNVVTHSGQQKVEESMIIILSTSLNERTMQEAFGCELSQHLFQPVDKAFLNNLRGDISDAFLLHEPRIKVEEIRMDTSQAPEGLLVIMIDYLLRSTNTRYNLVYPFYLIEATL